VAQVRTALSRFTLTALTLVLSACVTQLSPSHPGEALAAEWRDTHADVIARTQFRPTNHILVYLKPGVTEAQTRALVCDELEPHVPDLFNPPLGISVWDSTGAAVPYPDCPSS
jgi:hypothetical protein